MSDPDFARFTETVVSVLQVPADAVTEEAAFGDDLDADSLDLVELMMAIEEQFDVEIPEEDLEGVQTVGQAWALVQSKRA
jgi:acyl carrier protein